MKMLYFLHKNYFKHSRFEPKGGASLKQQNAKKNGEGVVKGRKAKKKADSEKALRKALDACLKNGCSVAEVEDIFSKCVKNLNK